MSLVAVVALFGAGVASFLAPCVAPLLPAYVGMLAGSVTDRARAGVVRAAVQFVVGFAAIFVALGGLAGAFASRLERVQGAVRAAGGVIVVALGALLLLAHRGRLAPEWRPRLTLPRVGSAWRPLVMGVAFGAAWTPCVGPLLGSALVVAADSSHAGQGAVLLGAYAAGVGVPFVACALLLESAPGLLERIRRAGAVVEPIAGVLLVGLGLLLVSGLYDRLTGGLARHLPTVGGG